MKPLIFRALFFAAGFALSAVAGAQCAAPDDCVRAIYAAYADGGKSRPFDQNKLFDKEVLRLWSRVKSLDYDFFVQGQDYKLSRVRLAKAEIRGDKARVKVEFFNFDTRKRLDYYLVQSADGWRIAEIKAGKESFRAYLKQGR